MVLKNTWTTFEAQFMQKLSNAKAGLKKSFPYKTSVYYSIFKKLNST